MVVPEVQQQRHERCVEAAPTEDEPETAVRSFVPGHQVVRPYTWSDEAGVEFWPLGRKRRHPSEAREEPDEALQNVDQERGAIQDQEDLVVDQSVADDDINEEMPEEAFNSSTGLEKQAGEGE